jgi:prepilin-type N-terminal cleavage/methylation domain-containing protein
VGRLGRRYASARGRGFTLTELLIVVMLIAVLAAVAIPMALDTDDIQASAAARKITGDLQYAQNQAIATQTPITVTFSASGDSYQLSNASGILVHPINKSSYVVSFSTQRELSRVDVLSADFGGTSAVTFDEMGAPGAGGSVAIQAGARTLTLNVADVTGLVSASD